LHFGGIFAAGVVSTVLHFAAYLPPVVSSAILHFGGIFAAGYFTIRLT